MRRVIPLILAGSAGLLLTACSMEPDPLDTAEIVQAALDDRSLILASEEPIGGPVSLEEATARALKYNLEHRVQVMEEALANESFELAKYDMLPILAAEAGVTARDSFNASSSESILTHQQSLEPSYSEDRVRYTASGRFSWNILDFGISYLQARQESNRFLIASLAREKAMRQMAQQVRTAYWRAAALQRVSPEVDRLLVEAERSRAELERVRQSALRAPLDTLEEIRSLAEIIQQLEAMQQSVSAAQIDLASLINAPVGQELELDVAGDLGQMPSFAVSLEDLELLALSNNADYAAQLYNVRVDADEARKSLLRLVPGVELFVGSSYDSNSYLVYNQWNEAGARVTWNIMRLLAAPQIQDQNEARELVSKARRLAANMAAITQLHLSWQEYRNALDRLDRAESLDEIDSEITELTNQAATSRAIAESVRLRNEVRALRSTVASMLAYAGAQEAYGTFLNALGLSPVPDDYQGRSLAELTEAVRQSYATWRAGAFPRVELPAPAEGQTETGEKTEPLLERGPAVSSLNWPFASS